MKLFVFLFAILTPGSTTNCQPPTANCQLKTANCLLPTENCLLPTENCQLPPADSLHAALDRHHDRLTAATLAEFDDAPANTWMNWTPAIGIGYAPNGEPRPTASFSLAQVFTNLQRNKERTAKRRALLAAAQLAREAAHRELEEMVQRYRMLSLELETMQAIFKIDEQLYSLALADYEAAKLSPMEFLPKKKAIMMEHLALERKEMEVAKQEGEILLFSQFNRNAQYIEKK